MSAVAVIDSLEFARAEQQLRGGVPLATLQRLEDVLFDSQGSLEYELRGTRDERNRPQLALRVRGALHLQCQRCLRSLDYGVDIDTRLLLLPRGAPEHEIDDPEGPDVIEASDELDVAALVEDEVLLSLPLAPRHPDGACESALPKERGQIDAPGAFAQLAALKPPRNNIKES